MNIKLDQFQGPLYLLLTLIEKEKLDISDVSVSKVAETYLSIVQKQQESFPELISYIGIAAKLVLLKTQLLLPYIEPSDEEEEENLVEKLKIYKIFITQAKKLESIVHEGKIVCFSCGSHTSVLLSSDSPYITDTQTLCVTLTNFLKRSQVPATHSIPQKKLLTIHGAMRGIVNFLKRAQSRLFFEMFTHNTHKADIIIHFLALLELTKINQFALIQKDLFSDIEITYANL